MANVKEEGMVDKVALVTGASSGIGQATARLLAENGFRVFGTSRRPAEPPAQGIEMIALDVTDDASVATCFAQVLGKAGQIDLLVNNAGTTILGPVEATAPAEAMALFETNFFGVHRMVRAVLPQMRAQGAGRIVTIGSIAGFLPKPFEAIYAASKHALEGYVETLDHEVRGFGIRAVLIEPGYMRTGFDAHAARTAETVAAYAAAFAANVALFRDNVAAGENPAGVAAAVLRAATSRNPRLRYVVGREAMRVRKLRSIMPSGIFDRAIRRRFQLAG